MLQMIRTDPVLGKCLLVAEPWDPGPGGYGVGMFGKEFREWNDTYRDEVRGFWRGEDGKIGALAGKVAGSAEIYDVAGRKPSHGVNFLAVHDGFTLADLVTYAEKHNEANGEENRDGHNNNHSWNCGVEGPTDDPEVNQLRRRDGRALLATLYASRGIPLIQQGDEMGRTQQGNNNAYAQDNEITWVDWERADGALVDYVAALHRFRRQHPALTRDQFLTGQTKHGIRDVVWLHPEGREMSPDDWNDAGASVLGMHLRTAEDEVLVWFNRRVEAVEAKLPPGAWTIGIASDDQVAVTVAEGRARLPGRSVVALVRAQVPPSRPVEIPPGPGPAQPTEIPQQEPPEGPPIQPDQVPGNAPEELPVRNPPEGPPREPEPKPQDPEPRT
jgi:glycogen operon protein